MLANIGPSTRVIPGHGPLGNRQDLLKFQVMLKGTHAEVSAMMKQGMKLKEIQKQGLSEQWLSWGAGFLNEEAWIAILYASIQVEL